MGHLHMRVKGLQSTIEKPPDTDLEENSKKKNAGFCTTVALADLKKVKSPQIYAEGFP